jgi:hypothetical protein
VEWIIEFRKKLKQRYPEGYLIGEMPDVFTPLAIDVQWNWNWFRRPPDIMAYSMPLMYNAWVTDCNIEHAQKGFLYGLLLMFTTQGLEGTLEDASKDSPEFAEMIRKMARLRAQTAHCTVGVQFEDCDGLTIEAGMAKRFSYARGESVVLINPTDKSMTTKLRLDLLDGSADDHLALGKPLSVLYRLDGAAKELPWKSVSSVLEIKLEPRDAVVWDLKKRISDY